jgi:hypothetical protein
MANPKGVVFGLLLCYLVLELVKSQNVVAVERLSSNVNILCDLDRDSHPLYWIIQGQVYELYSVPRIFRVRGYEAITLTSVDRRMDGWVFQCFNVNPDNEEGLTPGLITTLTVVYGKDLSISHLLVVQIKWCMV